MALVHQHLILSAKLRKPPSTAKEMNDFLLKVVRALRMKIFMEPRSKVCSEPANQGVTGIVGLETSHVSAHTWSGPCFPEPFVNADFYSCAEYDPQVVIDLVQQTWDAYDVKWQVIDRAP